MPVCFCAYLIGWYYEPTSRLLVMVASDDAKLYIYEGTTLLWSCGLLDTAIFLSRCFLKSLPGGLLTLSAKGIISVSYIGTEPDLNSNAAPMINETLDPEQVQAELEAVEEELQSVLESKGEVDNLTVGVAQSIKIKAEVGKPTQHLYQEHAKDNEEALHLVICPVVVTLFCEDPNMIQNIQITYSCQRPFTCSESVISLDSINGTEIIESQVFLTNDTEIADTNVDIVFTITDNMKKIVVLEKKVVLPISLYCLPANLDTAKLLKIYVHTNLVNINLSKIFSGKNELNILQKQFTLVQKRLLVQYGSLPPGNCDSLEFLMRDTHTRLVTLVHKIIECRENICRASCTLVTIGRLVIYVFKQSPLEPFKLKLIEEALCLSSLYDEYQEWEEAVSQSVSYILNNVFKNSEKDKEKLTPVADQGVLSHINLKRFLKQIRVLLEKLYLEAYGDEESTSEATKGSQITRIEEFVEVL
ncbi:unnamed protein product [Diatraea saccharalis]|uniref:Uncharacterized protein n=1 Tax=Diatraea saccharalis TaxID=40085 RepID=A0A9N9QUJ8_9NEOP|nr:unnamed protein product [Diatraea saccharalis]